MTLLIGPFRAKEIALRVFLSLVIVKYYNGNLVSIPVLLMNLLSITSFVNFVISKLFPKFGEGMKDRIADLLLSVKDVKKEYLKHLNEHAIETRVSTAENWKHFGPVITEIPEEGWSEKRIADMITTLSSKVERGLVGEDFSGSIYLYAFKEGVEGKALENGHHEENDVVSKKTNGSSKTDFVEFVKSLERLYALSFRKSFLWNSLHEGEFGIGYWLNYQVVRMVGNMFGGEPDKVMGTVTSGGTDTLMSLIRIYREWGNNNRDLDIGEPTIIAAENIHAAIDKGCMAYGINLVKIGLDGEGRISIKELKRAMVQYHSTVIAVFVSAPSYSLGLVDDVKAAAKIAKRAGVGLHVDCCLGGFIINFLEHYETDFLKIPGVTSISCDTHKNGWAPKGSSIMLTSNITDRKFGTINLSYYSAYSIPGWDGGVYGSPSNPGSQHCSHVFQAYVALLRIGKDGYSKIANNINTTVNACVKILKKDTRLEILGEHAVGNKGVNVFAFKIKSSLGWGFGASYALAAEMAKRNFVCSAIAGDRLHYCVTGRSALDPEFVGRFQNALEQGMQATELLAQQVIQGKAKFGGDAGLYGTLDSAMKPTSENTKSTTEYIGNVLLGNKVATDLIKAHFYALQDPYSKLEF